MLHSSVTTSSSSAFGVGEAGRVEVFGLDDRTDLRLGQSGVAGDADVLAEFVARVLQSGHPEDDHFPRPHGEGGAVEQLVDHLRPPGEDVGSVGEHSEKR